MIIGNIFYRLTGYFYNMREKENMSTSFTRASDVQRKWVLIDAEGAVLGRLAVLVANILRGKNKACFTPNSDCGDNVIVVNADKISLTGKKMDKKFHYWHTGYPGGIKKRSMRDLFNRAFAGQSSP